MATVKKLRDVERMLARLASDDDEHDADGYADKATDLQRLRRAMLATHVFKAGDLVRWKPGLKNRKRPAEGEPAIVFEVLDTPLFDPDSDGAGTPYFREPLSIMLGVLDDDGDFLTFHFDARRFEPFKED